MTVEALWFLGDLGGGSSSVTVDLLSLAIAFLLFDYVKKNGDSLLVLFLDHITIIRR